MNIRGIVAVAYAHRVAMLQLRQAKQNYNHIILGN